MFGLRSSPSTLVVPCSLRGAVTAEAGMGFAPRRLSAPRPKRVVMPIMYYADVVGASAGGGGAGLGYSPAAGPPSAPVSDYAGVFEAGCDPAQVRASLHRGSKPVETSVARAPLEEEETTPVSSVAYNHGGRGSGGGGGGGRSVFDDEADCLFPMDGLRDSVPERAGGVSSSGGIAAGAGGVGMDGGMSAAVGKTTTPVVAVAAGGGKRHVHAPAATPPTALRGAAIEKTAVYRGATTHQRRASRVIAAPGRRCVAGGGMYRLRLSTSC